MTVSTTTSRAAYSTNGTTGPFTVPFYFLANEHLLVTYVVGGVPTTYVLDTDYTVTGAGDPNGGAITLVSPLAAGGTITIVRDVPATQLTDYQNLDSFPAESHERALDKLTMIAQQQDEVLNRALVFPVGDETSGLLPSAADRASKLQGYDGSGAPAMYDLDLAASLSFSHSDANPAGTVGGRLAQIISVKDAPFNAVGDGVTDDTAAIQAAIDAAQALVLDRFVGPGVAVTFPDGTYLISSTLTIDTSNVYLVGGAPGAAMLYAPNADFDLVHFDGSALALYSVGMLNLKTYTPGNATAGCHIRVRRAINSLFDNIQCIGWYDGIISDGCAKTFYSNVILSQENRTNGTSFRYGFDFASTVENNSDVHVSDFQIVWTPAVLTNEYAIRIQGADGIWFDNGHHHGAVLLNPSSVTCASIFWSGVYFDASPTNHVVFNGTSAAYRNFKFSNCYMRDCAADAILFNASSTITKVEVVTTQLASNGTGIRVTSAVDDMVVGLSTFDDNNVGNSAANGDIIVTSGGVTVIGNRFIGGGAAGTTVALGASSADCIVTNNSMASSGPTVKVTNAGTNNRIRGNTGFVTKNFGQATINNPDTTVVVNHGLAVTPSVGQIRLTLNSASAGVTRFWPSTITATQFTINVDATPSTSATIGWAIDAEV